MCGIAGIMMRGGAAPDAALAGRLADFLRHRGPDSAGSHIVDAVALVHTRLAIIGIATGQQPLFGPGGTVLVANGEIYNDLELRAALPNAAFRTESDCEPPLHLYARDGAGYAQSLRGMYAMALYDPATKRLLLSRDPFGIKPLYYIETETCLAFASELQALLNTGLAAPGVLPDRRAELLGLKFTTGRQTIIPGIKRVLPGETLVIADARIVQLHSIDPLARLAVRPGQRRRRALAALDAVLLDSVARHLRAEVPYGLFLSGGIDSSALVRLMQRAGGAQVQAISIGYEDGRDETNEAARIAGLAGAAFTRVQMDAAQFWALAPRIAAAIDDPTTDAAVLPSWLLGQAARQAGLTVTLCGEGADELFGGYSRYRRGRLPWRLLQRKARTRGVFDGVPAIRDAIANWRSGLDAAEQQSNPAFTATQRLQEIDCREWLPNDLLIKLDRCLMAHGVEGRTPFVDPVVAAFAFALPDRLKIGARLGKLLLRAWLAWQLPGAQAFARKKGFKPPIGRWMAARSPALGALVAAQPGIADFLPADAVAAVFAAAAEQPQPAWSLLFYALWHSHHILRLDCAGNVAEVLAAAAATLAPALAAAE